LTNKLDIQAYYDRIVENVEPANLPFFFENFSTMLVETDESVCALAEEHQAHLDQLTKDDYKWMGIKQGILMSRVQYQHIAELQKRDLQCIKRKEQFRQRLVRAWGGDWEDQLHGLLLRELKDGFLARLARFATGAGQTLTKQVLRQGFQKSIEDQSRLMSYLESQRHPDN